jgi:hypothetical protein
MITFADRFRSGARTSALSVFAAAAVSALAISVASAGSATIAAGQAAAAPVPHAKIAPANFPVPRYDGLWSVSVITEKGTCDRGYRYPIRISNGTLANAGDAVFTITGQVVQTGAITVTVSAAGKSANGVGRLAGNIGAGSWTGGDCSGTWTAQRRLPGQTDEEY